jgi:hypothetical protein
MIQLNLLPDSRLYEIKSRKIYRLLTRSGLLLAIIVIVITSLLFIEVKLIQQKSILNNNTQISSDLGSLNKVTDFNQILKINNAISILPSLYNNRPDVTRLSGYLALITPSTVSIKSLQLNFATDAFDFSGTADSIQTINTFVDTLKFSEFTVGSSTTQQLAFSKVVLTNYSYSSSSTTSEDFSVIAVFSPKIFATNVSGIQLTVPNKITTRSNIDQPTALFNLQPNGK